MDCGWEKLDEKANSIIHLHLAIKALQNALSKSEDNNCSLGKIRDSIHAETLNQSTSIELYTIDIMEGTSIKAHCSELLPSLMI